MSDQSDQAEQAEPERRLETSVTHLLRDLPQARAPATLERRVLDQLQRRRQASGWQQGFTHWSMATRVTFVVVCVAAMVSLLWAGAAPFDDLRSLSDGSRSMPAWIGPLLTDISGAGDFVALLVALVPAAWLYVALGAGSLLYAALFGLGATAYRTLYRQPSHHR